MNLSGHEYLNKAQGRDPSIRTALLFISPIVL